jgi:hypothetical protein
MIKYEKIIFLKEIKLHVPSERIIKKINIIAPNIMRKVPIMKPINKNKNKNKN